MSETLRNTTAFNQNIGSWNVVNVTDMTLMLASSGLTRANYDALLLGWSTQNVKTGVPFSAGTIKYSSSSAVVAARAVLSPGKSWTITDGGGEAVAPGAPTDLIVSTSNGQILLSWTAPSDTGGSGISDYVIQYSTDGISWTTYSDGTSTNNSVTITGLPYGASYIFRVAAVNSAGTGSSSTSSSNVTPQNPCPTLCGSSGNGCYDNATAITNACATLEDGYETSGTPTLIEYKNADSNCTGGSCFKVWWQQGTNRILNASGLWTNGGVGAWQQALNRNGIGTNGDFNSSTQIAALVGRVCPGKTTGSGTFIDFTNMVDSTRCLYYDSGNTTQTLDAAGTSGTEASDWLKNWNRAATGRGTSSSYYEGNVKTCADKGMRLPVMYETTMTKPTSYLPTGDTGVTPTWAGSTNGVPSYLGYTWTASAYANFSIYYWVWSGTSSNTIGNYNSSCYVRCVLP
jgi:hypothetical protein